MKDEWCSKLKLHNGQTLSGAAARNVRIAALGGMEAIVKQVAENTLALALENIEKKAQVQPQLYIVK